MKILGDIEDARPPGVGEVSMGTFDVQGTPTCCAKDWLAVLHPHVDRELAFEWHVFVDVVLQRVASRDRLLDLFGVEAASGLGELCELALDGIVQPLGHPVGQEAEDPAEARAQDLHELATWKEPRPTPRLRPAGHVVGVLGAHAILEPGFTSTAKVQCTLQ